jgi:ABC-type bacteriocin/lantibiotic exporter with double-glycine peptidase domain
MDVISGSQPVLAEADRILVIGCPGSGKSTLAKDAVAL